MDAIAQQVRDFVLSNFLFGKGGEQLADDKSFLENGIIDSTGVLELMAFLEQQFGIAIDDRELVPENLDSVACVTRFVCRKLEAGAEITGQ